MITVINPHHALHAGRREMFRGRLVDSYEVPDRLGQVLDELQRRPLGAVREPDLDDPALEATLLRVHEARYLKFLQNAWHDWVALDPANAELDALPSVWPLAQRHASRHDRETTNAAARLGHYAFDSGTPLTAGTWRAALSGAACAVAAARAVSAGERSAFALTRPPGHHAGPNFYGGYCFINNAALAAQVLREAGHARVAVLDVDYHHGNGTQTIFYERPDVLTLSIHGDPRTEYPFFLGHADERGAGAGEGCNRNWPLPRGTDLATWRNALDQALRAVADFRATALVVPLGVDIYAGDPIAGFQLRLEDFADVGSALAGLQLPTVFTFEGGYTKTHTGVAAVNLLEGFERAA